MIVISDNLEVGKSFAGKQHLVKLTGLDAETSLSLVNSVLSNDEPPLEDQLDHLILACEGNPLLNETSCRLSQTKSGNQI
jgi:hypothetical protein